MEKGKQITIFYKQQLVVNHQQTFCVGGLVGMSGDNAVST